MRTFIVELGSGVDLHGQDPTKAAVRAVRDAFAHVSLPGLRAVVGIEDTSTVESDLEESLKGLKKKDRITHKVEVTRPEDIDADVRKWLRAAYERDGK